MNTDQLSDILKNVAAQWETPTFDTSELRNVARARSARLHHRALALSLTIVVVGGASAATAWIHVVTLGGPAATHTATHSAAAPTSDARIESGRNLGLGPPAIPPVAIKALGATKHRVNGQRVLARTPAGTPVSVRARLYFRAGPPGRVRDTAIVIAKPGSQPGAGAGSKYTGGYYRAVRVAISALVSASSSEQRFLTVTTPRKLVPGIYPVLTVINTVPLQRQQAEGQTPVQISSELGVIVVSSP